MGDRAQIKEALAALETPRSPHQSRRMLPRATGAEMKLFTVLYFCALGLFVVCCVKGWLF